MILEYLILGGLFLAMFLLVKNAGAFTVSTARTSLPIGVSNVPYSTDISNAARAWGVDEALIKAVIRQESNFNPNAINSNDPSYGLMQVGLMVAQDFGIVRDYKAPTEIEIGTLLQVQNNINTGARKLSSLLNKYPFDTAIQMYNVGEAGFNKGYRASQYLANVKRFYNEYKK
jgi:soluble lytic murein transglycosylase-like protein